MHPITGADLYCMAMESETAYKLMPQLCKQLGIPLETVKQPVNEAKQARREALADPILE